MPQDTNPVKGTPFLIGAVQVGSDRYGYAVWQKDGELFTCHHPGGNPGREKWPATEADIVKRCEPPWPYPYSE